ncbi:S9 family peptidase [uncultured Traorella sp.]|uniref:alpha/beta hydrolase family protein n=1 Tax=uncultured Traorella sp. TaxID=1929048 RepID=UPI0025D91E81|nr:S9 family peptidase [uncultured Traorella sp.]
MEKLALKDFLKYRFISNLKLGQDGSCVFALHECEEENNSYRNNLYMLKDGECRPLTQSGKDGQFQFIDPVTLLFISHREASKDEEEKTSFYKISLDGGEAIKAFDVPFAVASFECISKDVYLLAVRYDKDYSYGDDCQIKEERLKRKKEDEDYEVFTKIPFYFNGAGFVSNTIIRLYLYDASADELTAITSDEINVSSYRLNKEKNEVLFVANEDLKKTTDKNSIQIYSFENKSTSVLLPEKEYQISDAFYFNDYILFIGNCEWKHGRNENERFFLLDDQGNVSLFYDNEMSLWGSVGSDCRYGGGIFMKADQNILYYISTVNEDSVIMSLNADKQCKEVVHISGSVDCFDVCDGKLMFVGMKDGKLQEVYEYQDAQVIQKTCLNEDVLKNKYVSDYEEVRFVNDGIDFVGWVLKPVDYDPNKTYPAILDIHGGPKTAYGKVFYHEMQVWANLGYFVFFTNPRGSDGRDNEFMDIFGKYGTIDYDDLMKFTDAVLEKYPAIDKARLGVTGGSYGGFMTNWIISHTNRFACAATQRSISNWISFYGTSDIGHTFASDQIHGNIFDSYEKLWEHSPLKYAKNIQTPTLFIHSDQDYRCPLEQGLQLYTAMVDLGIEARFVLFHGENHELSRSGKPKHRVRRLEEITAWMEKYLK